MKNKKVLIALICGQLFYVLFSVVWFTFFGLSLMIFDTPVEEIEKSLLVLFYAIAAYPLALIGSSIASWIFYKKGKFKKAIFINCLPLIWVLPVPVFLIFAYVIG